MEHPALKGLKRMNFTIKQRGIDLMFVFRRQKTLNDKSSLTKQNHDLSVCNLYNLFGHIIVLYSEGWVSKWYIILKFTLFTSHMPPKMYNSLFLPCLHHFAWCTHCLWMHFDQKHLQLFIHIKIDRWMIFKIYE